MYSVKIFLEGAPTPPPKKNKTKIKPVKFLGGPGPIGPPRTAYESNSRYFASTRT